MTTIDQYAIAEEIKVFLRNQDILSTTTREVTTATQNFTAGGVSSFVSLTNTNVKNVRSVTTNAVTAGRYTDYIVDYEGANPGRITFTFTPPLNTSISVNYDYGSTDHIFSDFPRADINMSSYPRISCEVTTMRTNPVSITAGSRKTDVMVSISMLAESRRNVLSWSNTIRDNILSNKNTFYYFKNDFEPLTAGSIVKDPNRKGDIEQKTDDYIIKNIMEITT
jgi:uncharacterized protein YeeX (DUF496 family)